MSEISVLICEDDHDLRSAISDGLTQSNFKVFQAKDGAEAVTQALNHHPDVILMDILMPELNGHEAVAKIRRDPWGKNSNIIYLTALSDAENVVKAVESGSEAYIIKPHASLADIIEKIRWAKHT